MTKYLAIETSTAACSVALVENGEVIAARHIEVGRGHAERLVPMIAELPNGGHADAILVDCGPGSFTGIRVGIAAARGLALGWNVPVHGFSSLPLVASQAFTRDSQIERAAVVLEGGHGEVFVKIINRDYCEVSPFSSVKPDAALELVKDLPIIGNGVRHLAALMPNLDLHETLPNAADARHLPNDCINLPPRPIYGRAPDAKPKAA